MDDRTHSFGYWLRRRRKALDLTQEALAQAVSCSRFAIRKIEADERRPSRGLAQRLADRLAIPGAERGAFMEAARAARPTAALPLDRAPLDAAAGELRSEEPGASPFVGRASEFGELVGALARLTTGTGQVVLLEGEPGIGKSRLMQELAAYTDAQELPALSTRCYEIERATACQPVIDLVSQALQRAPGTALAKLSPVALAEIADLVPALAQRVAVQALSGDFPQARQARLFQAIASLFDAVAGGRQLVVMVDDIQWADDASMQFLHCLARGAAQRPLLLVCAYRDEEMDMQERLPAFVSSLQREHHARHIVLSRLGLADAQAMVARLDDPRLGEPGLAERLHRETDGNPFFLTSMLHSIAQGEAHAGAGGALPLPDALRASVRARIAHVDAVARSALDAAAVVGRRFDFDTLLAVTRRPEEELLTALEALVRRRLLREGAEDGLFDFSHDKVREVVYREIVGARRVRLHRAVAEALEERGDGAPAERHAWLAEHYERAQDWKKAMDYALLAADRSGKLFAMRDALHWLDRAVAIAESHPQAIPAESRVDVHARRGMARALAGQTEGAVDDIRGVMEDARLRGDRAAVRDAFIQLGMAYRRADDYTQAAQCLAQALAECRAMGDERRAADTLYHLGTVMWSNGRNAEAIAYHQEAVDICERLGITDLVAVQAWHGRGEAHFNDVQPAAAVACYERSIALARGIGDRAYECENLMMIAFACTGYMGLADYARARASYEASLAIAREADLQWHLGPTLLGLEHVRACTGGYGEAWNGMARTLAWLEGVKQTRYQLIACDVMTHLLLEVGRNAHAARQCEHGLALATREGITFWRPRLEAHLAVARLRMGDLHVGASLESARADCRRNREGTQEARCLEALAELALAKGDAAGCRSYAQDLLALAGPSGMAEWQAEALRWRGEALCAAGDAPGARSDLEEAAALAARVGRPRLARDIHRALARVHQAGGGRDEAQRHAREAERIDERIGASLAGSALGASPEPAALPVS
ncbi:MAG TPA: AAA family ATPase [Usitatibacter sp.]|nr:AAA family ATPase [Usitatibacter sp.]